MGKVLRSEGDSATYLYDFDDDWQHEVVLEKIQRVKAALSHPVCLGGECRCPPEDVGGVHGHQEFLGVILDPKHGQYEQLVRWAGGHFHDEFHPKTVNAKLSRTRWPVRHGYRRTRGGAICISPNISTLYSGFPCTDAHFSKAPPLPS